MACKCIEINWNLLRSLGGELTELMATQAWRAVEMHELVADRQSFAYTTRTVSSGSLSRRYLRAKLGHT